MKKNEPILSLHEKVNPRGQVYFSGTFDGGGKVIMVKLKSKLNNYGEPLWEIRLVK